VNSSYWKNSKWIVLGSRCFKVAVDKAESLDAQQHKSKSCLNPQQFKTTNISLVQQQKYNTMPKENWKCNTQQQPNMDRRKELSCKKHEHDQILSHQ
jgi:hypothetical protein